MSKPLREGRVGVEYDPVRETVEISFAGEGGEHFGLCLPRTEFYRLVDALQHAVQTIKTHGRAN